MTRIQAGGDGSGLPRCVRVCGKETRKMSSVLAILALFLMSDDESVQQDGA